MRRILGPVLPLAAIMLGVLFVFGAESTAQVDPFAPPPAPSPSFSCPYCSATFQSQSELDAHIEDTHTFECPYCDEVFHTQEELDGHISASHTYSCPECGAEFRSRSEMESHIESSHRFVKSGSVITDYQTDLQWRVGPDSDMNWYEARDWVNGLGGGWRMPTRSELRGLYNAGITDDDWGPFENSGYMVWTGEERDSSSAWYFLFNDGYEFYNTRDFSYYLRAFAVRSR